MSWSKLFNWERFIHSVKTAIACIIGYLLTKFISLPADQWVIVTIIVVMCAQIYVGSVLQKAYLRFLGTLAGCLFAAAAILTLGTNHSISAITIAASSFLFSYIATSQERFSYAGTLGAVTTAIIMLGQQPTLIFAIERCLEISLGLLIATLVSQFVLPIHARTHLLSAQAETLKELRDYYIACMVTHDVDAQTAYYRDFDETIVKTLSRQRQLAKEAGRERFGKYYDPKHFIQTLHQEKEILRAIDFMHHALVNLRGSTHTLNQSKAFDSFNDTIIHSLNTLIRAIESENSAKEHIHIPSIGSLQSELQKNVAPTEDSMVYADGFLFSAEILLRSLSKLARLYQITVQPA